MDDSELLRTYARDRSETAFAELVRRHLALVHGSALRQVNGDAHLAQDVAQRVFIVLARKADALSRHQTLVGWLYTAARVEGARAVRTELRRRRREEGAADMHQNDTPEIPGETLSAVLDDAMGALRDEDREAVLLRFFSAQSFAEIGRMLQVSEEAARKRVDRALDKLREHLGRRGIVSTASGLASALSLHAAPAVSPALTTAVVTGAVQQLAAHTTTLSVGFLMSSSKGIALTAGLLVLATSFVIYDHNSLQRLEGERTSAEATLAEHNGRQAKLAAELDSLQREVAASEKAIVASTVATPRPAASAAPAYLTDPKYRQLARDTSKTRRHLEFQRLYRRLQLTPEQIERFEAIMVRQDEAKLDAALVRADGGDEQTVYRRSGPEWSSAMTALLGREGFKALEDYLRTMPVRAFVDKFTVYATANGIPLTADQSEELATLALANDGMYRQGKGTDPGTVNWNDVWDPAAELVSVDQLALLQRTVEVWALQKQVSLQSKSQSSARR